jgi:hypothetical protein
VRSGNDHASALPARPKHDLAPAERRSWLLASPREGGARRGCPPPRPGSTRLSSALTAIGWPG